MKCPRCGEPEHPDQCTVPAQAGGMVVEQWICFHCDEVFTDRAEAAKHFGTSTFDPAVCVIDAGEVSELRADRDYASSQLKEMTRQRDELRSRVHALRSKYEPATVND